MQAISISRDDIIDLQAEALGIDPEMVSICQQALAGDTTAYAECERIITSTREESAA